MRSISRWSFPWWLRSWSWPALAGCGEGAVNADDGYYENRVYGIKEEVPLKNAVTGAIEYGQFGSEIAVAEVTVTNDIASPEANALLPDERV